MSGRFTSSGLFGKRLLDCLLAGLALPLLAPVMALVALAVRCRLGSPILFRQVRAGYRGEPITVHKFRTMSEERTPAGALLPDSQRLTRLGRFLRSWSLDELPQLWDVLRGSLSLVGPRPLLLQYNSRYSPEQRRRLQARPGITGWAQISGRNALSWQQRLGLDVWYVDHWSLWLDIRILWTTVFRVLGRQGISANGHATMPEFIGNCEAGPASGKQSA